MANEEETDTRRAGIHLADLETGRVYSFGFRQQIVVGRAHGDHLPDVVVEHPDVLPNHCTLEADLTGGIRIDDNSSSGTFLNGVKVKTGDHARPGDQITLASSYVLCVLQPPATESLVGQTITDRFLLLRRIGKGGMGTVYACHDRQESRLCAMKFLEDGASEDARVRFHREAQVGALLGAHPGIVNVYQVGRSEEHVYLVMELVEGPNLREAISVGLERAEGLRLVLEAARALAFAHSQGVVHRDLKPDNVVLGGEPRRAHLTDFGIAKLEDSDLTLAGALLGTVSTMAPEQIRDSSRVGPAVDVYGLGGLLYTILTGLPPYRGPNTGQLVAAVLKGELVPPREHDPTISEDLEALCLRALATDPEKRPPSAKVFADEIATLLTQQ